MNLKLFEMFFWSHMTTCICRYYFLWAWL